MGPNPSFRFVKNMMRDSPKVSYTEHLLSSSISLKNKEVLIYLDGGGDFWKWAKFLKHYGSCFSSPLNMEPICIFLTVR
jgi:hypothetical protein